MFSSVCLCVLSLPLLAAEKITIGGLYENKLKKLKGLRFAFPSLSIVLANAIGLGAMAYCSQFIFSVKFKSLIIIDCIIFNSTCAIRIFFLVQNRKIAFFF